jgi:hypothetical protein
MAASGIRHTVSSVPISRSQYESEEHHSIISGTSFPTSPVEKQLFYRTDLHKLYYYNGVNWVDMAGGGVTVHNDLTGRDAADCHPLEAITGLASHASRHQDGGADEINIAGLSGEPAELTTHKNLTTGVHGAGSNYLALAPAASHLVRSFTKGWTSGKLLKGAGVNTDPTEIDKSAFGYLGSDELFIRELFPARMARLIYKLWTDKNGFTERNTGGTNYTGLEILNQSTGATINNIAAIGSPGIYVNPNTLNSIIMGAAFYFNSVVDSNTVYLGFFTENPASAYPTETNPHMGFKVVNGRIWTICKGTAAQTTRDTGLDMSQYATKWFTILYTGGTIKLLVDAVDYTPSSPSIPNNVTLYWWSYIQTLTSANREISLMSLNLLRGYSA